MIWKYKAITIDSVENVPKPSIFKKFSNLIFFWKKPKIKIDHKISMAEIEEVFVDGVIEADSETQAIYKLMHDMQLYPIELEEIPGIRGKTIAKRMLRLQKAKDKIQKDLD